MDIQFNRGDRVRLTSEAREFGLHEASEYGTVVNVPKYDAELVRVLIDGGAEDYFHRSFLDKLVSDRAS